ncbi:MAG: HIT domain-containing protein [Verrucomicrobiota bacterium]
MDHLWAPWRSEYIEDLHVTRKKRSEHLFFDIGQSADDEDNLVFFRSKSCYAILNRFPYNSGHCMVIPYRELAELKDLSTNEKTDLWETVDKVTDALKQAYKPHGFNIGINMGVGTGAGFPHHLHVHIVPRWKEDANFLTTTAETRIHPKELSTIYQDLKKNI